MGDETRFRELFDQTYPSIIRYAYNRGYRRADAEDLAAGTFEVAWRRLDDVPAGQEATPWLLAVARNLSRNADRRARRQEGLIELSVEPDHVPTPGQTAVSVEARAELLGALQALKEIDRELVLLVARDGLSPTSAGAVLGLRPGAARSRLHRARNQLAGLLGAAATPGRSRGNDFTGNTAEERT